MLIVLSLFAICISVWRGLYVVKGPRRVDRSEGSQQAVGTRPDIDELVVLHQRDRRTIGRASELQRFLIRAFHKALPRVTG